MPRKLALWAGKDGFSFRIIWVVSSAQLVRVSVILLAVRCLTSRSPVRFPVWETSQINKRAVATKGAVIIYGQGGPESKVTRHRKYFKVKRVGLKKIGRNRVGVEKIFAADAASHIL